MCTFHLSELPKEQDYGRFHGYAKRGLKFSFLVWLGFQYLKIQLFIEYNERDWISNFIQIKFPKALKIKYRVIGTQ